LQRLEGVAAGFELRATVFEVQVFVHATAWWLKWTWNTRHIEDIPGNIVGTKNGDVVWGISGDFLGEVLQDYQLVKLSCKVV
jgi:hypothetical protein